MVLQDPSPPSSLAPHLILSGTEKPQQPALRTEFFRVISTLGDTTDYLPHQQGRYVVPRDRRSREWLEVLVFLSWLEDPGHHDGGLGSCSRCTQGRAPWVTNTDHTLRSLGIPFPPLSLLLFLCGTEALWGVGRVGWARPVGQPCLSCFPSTTGLLWDGEQSARGLCGLQNGRPSLNRLFSQVLFRVKALHRVHSFKSYTFLW